MKSKYSSTLGSFIARHLKLRASLGYDDYGTRGCLRSFDFYLKREFPKLKVVTRPVVLGYLNTLKHLHPRTRLNRILSIRQFCRYLFQFNADTYIPEKNLVPQGKTTVRPHIYSENEVHTLISHALRLTPKESLRPHAYSTLFSLLSVSGIRIGEALKLNIENIDFDSGILTILETKFLKSRLIPLSRSSILGLENYIKLRNSYGYDKSPSAPLFINLRARRFKVNTVDMVFSKLILAIGIKTLQGTSPRLHDLRHSFATRWLEDFYKSGKDPSAYLPVLATYLGHAGVVSTQTYLHPSLNLLEVAGSRFENHIS